MIGQMIMAALAVAGEAAPPGEAMWTPANLSNTKAWYVADNPDNTIVSGLTTALADKGGGGFTATAVAAGAAMSDSLNGRAVLRTSGGAGIFMTTAGGDAIARNAGGVSIFVVHRQISRDGASYPAVASTTFGAGSTTLQIAMMREQAGHGAGSINLRTRPASYLGGIEVSDETNYGASWLVAGGSRRFNHDDGTLWINGMQTATAAMDSDGVTQNADMSLMIGSYNALGSDLWSLNIAEIVFVRDDLSVADRLRLEGYLAWEWGRQGDLPEAHPYKAGRPMEGDPDEVPPPAETWMQIAVEDGSFTLAEPGRVRFGADVRWIEADLPAGTSTCSNYNFGSDPAEGSAKVCQLLVV